MYDLHFRVVRFLISDGNYETVYTNLDAEDFPIGKIKDLYRVRWGIETSFRALKYAVGLASLHDKKIRPGRQYKRYQNSISAVAFQYRLT